MKLITILAITLFAHASSADYSAAEVTAKLEAQPVCQNSVRFDDEYIYLGFGPYLRGFESPRVAIPSIMRIVPLSKAQALNTTTDFKTLDASLDFAREGDSLFALTFSSIEEFSLSRKERVGAYATHTLDRQLLFKEHAQGFARYGNQVVIAHGRRGVSIFDLSTKNVVAEIPLVQSQLPLESMATGIAINGKHALVVMDNFTLVAPGEKPPFRGLVIVDLEQQKVVSELSGLDVGADSIMIDGDRVVVSYMGYPLWIYSLGKILAASEKLPRPEARISQFGERGRPSGRGVLDADNYYTCFMHHPKESGASRRAPRVLKRVNLKM